MEIKDKVVLVTGSSIGIGREAVLEFAKEGAKVVVTYNKHKKEAEQTFKECKKLTDCLLIKLNVTNLESIKKCVEETIDKFGAIDILVNNAGVVVVKRFVETRIDDLKFQIDVNLLGLMNMTKIVLPYMLIEEGTVINISSTYGKEGADECVAYCASKFGVRGFTQAIAKEYPKNNIRFYCINPDLTATAMTGFEGVNPKEVAKIIVRTAREDLGKKSGDDVDVWELL